MKISAVLLAISLWGAWALASAAIAAGWPGQGTRDHLRPEPSTKAVEYVAESSVELIQGTWQEALVQKARQVVGVIEAGYVKAPTLVLVLSALLILPVVAIASLVVQKSARAARRMPRRQPPLSADWTRGPRPGPDIPAWPAQAWLSIDGDAADAHPIAGEMIRIGRHPDNEVWLTDTSVHRYHAVIHRTEDADFFITDLSGEEGNGIRINGMRRVQSPLADGDVIELGKARITFASIPI